jgi:arsenite/tail-anchored protein-transporting ATPase
LRLPPLLLFNMSVTDIFMFTGKGGVGKTTCSAATALHYAASGPTLIISTDATPSLSHIFETTDKQKSVKDVPDLSIEEIGEKEIREMWDAKFGREVYEVFSAFVDIEYGDFVEFMTSVLPGLGEEFMVDHIRGLSLSGKYKTIVWDTAPLGQTLGLLETPALLSEHLRLAPRVYSRLKLGKRSREPVMDIIERWKKLSADNMEFLRKNVTFTMVTIPEALAVEQLEGIFRELDKYGLPVKQMIINNTVKIEDSLFLRTKAFHQRQYLMHIHEKYSHLKITEIPMFPREVKGVARLKEVAKILFNT